MANPFNKNFYKLADPEPQPKREYVACAVQGCSECAVIRHPSGNLCRKHYDEMIAKRAHQWCLEHGLTTKEKMTRFCNEKKHASDADPTRWARTIIEEYEHGGYPYRHHYEDACKVANKEPIPWAP